eukprot:813209-Amphidinium_carterae.1
MHKFSNHQLVAPLKVDSNAVYLQHAIAADQMIEICHIAWFVLLGTLTDDTTMHAITITMTAYQVRVMLGTNTKQLTDMTYWSTI